MKLISHWFLLFLCAGSTMLAPYTASADDAMISLPSPNMHAPKLPPIPSPPTLSAKGYLLLDANSGLVLAEKNSRVSLEPASLTKLMSLHLIFQALKAGSITLHDAVTISERAWKAPGSRMFLQPGEQVTVENLLRGIIVASGNDATIAMAEHLAGSENNFVDMMNQNAAYLDMQHTHFDNATGLPTPTHRTTAYDMALLTRAIIKDYPEYYPGFSQKQISHNHIQQSNRNRLLWQDKRVDGLKTGHTQSSGYSLITSATDKKMRLITIMIGCNTEQVRNMNTESLLGYGFRFYESIQLKPAKAPFSSIKLWQGTPHTLSVGSLNPIYISLPKGHQHAIKWQVISEKPVVAPVKSGTPVAKLVVYHDNNMILNQPLVALEDGELGYWWTRWWDTIALKIQQNIPW